ncbi:MAG: hypothetical protein HQK98_10335 [Nitrospirae bacterium]|nr:hypothetical protein [Nitrospirota bacterium]
MSVIAIPKPLREKLGEEATDALIEVLNKVEPDTARIKAELTNELATKADVVELRVEIEKVRSDLSVKIENASKENIKWMFLFWTGQVAVTIAIIKFLILK